MAHTLDSLLESWSVGDVDSCHCLFNPETAGLLGWYWVCNDTDGVIAYFKSEKEALHFRLSIINATLNPPPLP